MDQNKLERDIRDRLASFEANVDAGNIWKGIEVKRGKSSKRRALFFMLFGSLGSILLLLVIFFKLGYHSGISSVQHVNEHETPALLREAG